MSVTPVSSVTPDNQNQLSLSPVFSVSSDNQNQFSLPPILSPPPETESQCNNQNQMAVRTRKRKREESTESEILELLKILSPKKRKTNHESPFQLRWERGCLNEKEDDIEWNPF